MRRFILSNMKKTNEKLLPKSPDERCGSSDIAIYNTCIKSMAGILYFMLIL